jgi:ribonuclease VapC
MSKGPFIFDSHALLKFFQKEKGYEKVLHLLEEIEKSGATKFLNVINLGEIIYSTKREFGDQKKLEVVANIERLNFTPLLHKDVVESTACPHQKAVSTFLPPAQRASWPGGRITSPVE